MRRAPLLVAPLVLAAAARGQDARELAAAARAVVEARCVPCHHPDSGEPKAIRELEDASDLAGLAAELVAPGDPEWTDLWLLLTDPEAPMPPEDAESGPLTEAELATMKAWIAAGAPSPARGGSSGASATPPGGGEPGASDRYGAGSGGSTPAGADGERAASDAPAHAPQAGTKRGAGLGLLEKLGRLHPLVIHFPIALLLAALLAEALGAVGRSPRFVPVVRFCLALGAATAALAALLGWFLARSERASFELTVHRWTGVAVAVLAAVTFALGERAAWDATPAGRRALRWSLAAVAVLVCVAGHYGGLMTYGDDWFPFP